MSPFLQKVRYFSAVTLEKTKERKGLMAVLTVLVVFQLYFVRELLAAELLFGIGFAFLLLLGVIFYAVGALGERAFDGMEAGVRVVGHSARRGYARMEEFSKKPFRHPRSESAQ